MLAVGMVEASLREGMAVSYESEFAGIHIDDEFDPSQKHPVLGFKKRLDPREGDAFRRATEAALDKIASRTIGRELLTLIGKRAKGIGTKRGLRVTIHFGTGTYEPGKIDPLVAHRKGTYANPRGRRGAHCRTDRQLTMAGQLVSRAKAVGRGSSVEVSYNPFINRSGIVRGWLDDAPGLPPIAITVERKLGVTVPAFVALAHELVHALHHLSGDTLNERMDEEARTIGAGRFAGARISENAVRREHGLKERAYYSTPGDCGVRLRQ